MDSVNKFFGYRGILTGLPIRDAFSVSIADCILLIVQLRPDRYAVYRQGMPEVCFEYGIAIVLRDEDVADRIVVRTPVCFIEGEVDLVAGEGSESFELIQILRA
jgi:hypothetical protein